MDQDVTLICTAANHAAAEELAATFPGGAGTFSRAISDDAKTITHYAGSGHVPAEMVEALAAAGLAEVIDNAGTTGIEAITQRKALTEARATAKGEVLTTKQRAALKDFAFIEVAEQIEGESK